MNWVTRGNSSLQFQLADEIAFSKRCAIVAENAVGRGRMEKETRQRERHQEAFRRERKRSVADSSTIRPSVASSTKSGSGWNTGRSCGGSGLAAVTNNYMMLVTEIS